MLKVAVIGGGSSYTPELVEGLIRHHAELPVTDLFLVDVPAGREKLEIVGALAQRMVEREGNPFRIHLTMDRRAAVEGAAFVLTQLRVGMLAARAKDERIPLKFDLLGQETTGPGGMMKALRTIPVILDICRDIRELSPQAMLVNFTNPAGIVTEAVIRHGGGVRAAGLCNNPINMRHMAADLLEVPVEQVYLQMFGVNHLSWARAFVNGVDRTQDVLARMAQNATNANIPAEAWDTDFLLSHGFIPGPYQRYYYMLPELLEAEKTAAASQGTRAEVVQAVERDLFTRYQDPNLKEKPPELAKRGGARYSEAAVNLLVAIHGDRHEDHVVNVRNGSTLPDLPADASVEVNCSISRTGIQPLAVGPLPPQIRGLLQAVKAYEELTVAAAVSGDRGIALQAIAANPLVGSIHKAKAALNALLETHKDHLPQFFPGAAVSR